MFLLGMLFLFPLFLILFLSPFFRFLFSFFFNNFVPVPRSSRRPSVLVSIPLYFLLFYNPTSPAIAFPFPFIAAQKPFFVPMLDVGMQKFPGRREDIEESWMEITKNRAVYINAGYGKGGEVQTLFLQNVTQNGGMGRGCLITHRRKQIYLFPCDLASSLVTSFLPRDPILATLPR